MRHFIELNRELSKHPKWIPITVKKDALSDADNWKDVKDKLHLLDRNDA